MTRALLVAFASPMPTEVDADCRFQRSGLSNP